MDSGAARVYKEFEPTWDSVSEEDCDILLLYLTGFTKEQIRVQLTRTRKLIVSGERAIEGNTWTRFRKQFAVSDNCDVNGISARFVESILYVRLPKLPIPAKIVDQELQKPKNSTEDSPQLPQNAPSKPSKNSTEDSPQLPQKAPSKPSKNSTEDSPQLPQKAPSKPSKNSTEDSPQLPQKEPSKPSKTDAEIQNNTDKKNSEDTKELPDLKDAKQPKDEEMEHDTKSPGVKKRNNYELRYKSVIDRVGVEVKSWSKMMMILVVITIVLLGIYINHYKATKQPLSLI